jgi:hypothetical protein
MGLLPVKSRGLGGSKSEEFVAAVQKTLVARFLLVLLS